MTFKLFSKLFINHYMLQDTYLQVPQILCSRAPCLVGPGLWRSLPEDLRDCTSLHIYIYNKILRHIFLSWLLLKEPYYSLP